MYLCRDCGACVGTHKGTVRPLGRMASREVRQARRRAHSVFDPLWSSGEMTRSGAYKWLSEQMGIKKRYCHIGYFGVEECNQVIEIMANRNNGEDDEETAR